MANIPADEKKKEHDTEKGLDIAENTAGRLVQSVRAIAS